LAEDRISNFNEVPYGYTEDLAVEEAKRCLQCGVNAPCIKNCPVNINIPKFIEHIANRNFDQAVSVVKENNLLPAICGRVCPQEEQCQKECIVGKIHKDINKSVSIGNLERFVADYEMSNQKENEIISGIKSYKVAIIGSGPAGLTAGGELRRMGYDVHIFEALHLPGGVLTYGIPEFRLPKQIVNQEVENLKNMGVIFHYNYVIGKTLLLSEILNEYQAVFVGTGAGLPNFLNIPGENYSGVYSANEYLTRCNMMKSFQFPNASTPLIRGKIVAVVGGGNVAMDSARTALRLGAEKVILIYRRSFTEMPARIEEVHRAKEEGVEFHNLENPTRIIGDENYKVTGIEVIKMELQEPDASGRRRPVALEGSEHQIPVDTVIMSLGTSPNPLISSTTEGLQVNKWKCIVADEETGKTTKEGVYAGGDAVTGAATVILAMGAGRKAADSIHDYLMFINCISNQPLVATSIVALASATFGTIPRPRCL